MPKKCEIWIEHCNSSCPYFYHSYEDSENSWCAHEKMNKKIFDCLEYELIFFDHKPREIPKDCPLEDFVG